MALGSWQGLYNAVILDLMRQQRERELLLLMAITTHADAFGFCYPGRARQMDIRHCAKSTQRKDETWLVENKLLYVEEVYDAMRRVERPFYQVSPRAMYIREDLQDYCEAIFDGKRERDFAWEKKLILILSSAKESQPESLTRTRIRVLNQSQNPTSGPDTEPAETAQRQKGRTATTMRNGEGGGKAQSEAPKDQRRKAQDRKKEPPGGASDEDEFDALLSPTVDDDRLIQEIRHVASTTEYQAADAVATYTRETLVHWLRIAARRRKKGQLSSPGGWFFQMLRKNGERLNQEIEPNGNPVTYQDFENDNHSDDMEV
jgi:hypothetical protein